jgi:hypothetical protein
MYRRTVPALALAFAIPCAAAAVAEPAGISDALRAPAGEQLAFVMNAQGVQIYACKPGTVDPVSYEMTFHWTFVAPEATLLVDGKPAGHHGAGPVWESKEDGSRVKGAVRQKQDGGAGNIPWLLLAGTSEGAGRFAGVTSVQRVATRGGVEPKDGCDATKAGREARVPYTAQYYFYRRG